MLMLIVPLCYDNAKILYSFQLRSNKPNILNLHKFEGV
jgi:hypothetical protein